jgi:hypothetical protein
MSLQCHQLWTKSERVFGLFRFPFHVVAFKFAVFLFQSQIAKELHSALDGQHKEVHVTCCDTIFIFSYVQLKKLVLNLFFTPTTTTTNINRINVMIYTLNVMMLIWLHQMKVKVLTILKRIITTRQQKEINV